MPWTHYGPTELAWIGVSVLLISMSKGGFPIGNLAIPVLILVWPDPERAARGAVAFMLPMLCVMDLFAVCLYRRRIRWDVLRPLAGGTVLGVLLATLCFVSADRSLLAVSDRVLKLSIGMLGLAFVLYQYARARILRRMRGHRPGALRAHALGVTAGLTSTLAHAAMPVMQMYLLPRGLPKKEFAATTAAYFWALNLLKVLPFVWGGRFSGGDLALGALMLPLIPAGVLIGYAIVHVSSPRVYAGFIYAALAVTSVLLVFKGATGG
ncbi:MAG: sulfite exporter TauE/SafE family protein [Lentisphaerae bacterium]|nr:sulfite exporter TauE/SafE family protein [Lentisphaerota bacterium]